MAKMHSFAVTGPLWYAIAKGESGQGAASRRTEKRNTGGSMSIEIEESVDDEAVGLDNGKPSGVRPGARDHLADGDRAAGRRIRDAGAEADRRRRQGGELAVSRLLHRQHPQPEHARRVRRRQLSFCCSEGAFVQSVAGLRRNSQWLLSTMADRFETTAIGVYAVALRGRAALRLLTLAGGSGAGTVFLRNCPSPIFFANADRCAA
jgi:hypothetical protein